MPYAKVFNFMLLPAWVFSFTLSAAEKAVNAKPPTSPLEAIDQLFRESKPEKAKELIDQGLAKAANDPELLWRQARALVAAGDRATDKDVQLKLFEKSKETAERAIQLKADLMMGYLRRAIACGKISLFKGVLESRELVAQTKADAEKAIQLNNSTPYGLALAHYLLGRLHLKLAETPKVVRMPLGLAWGNIQDAETHLAKAVEIFPDAPPFQTDYGKALLKLGKKDQARQALQKAVDLPTLDYGDPERQAEAKDLLKQAQ